MLKSLELFGFKSFADRTRFDLSSGVTAVVGPNGSGKSNVVDAIKWLLGDQSAKSLRGKEMTDVIFNGSAGRKPSGMAEALLTFDNSQGLLEHEATEVQIGRRLWRSGDSEYLINREVVRRKDILQLLMGTGAGSSAYCIIEQGRVDQILQSNAASRRSVFEEAAGISKFKSRRVEASRKLERVEQNLLRLTDIVDELDTQLTALRSQAARAARYRETSSELKTLWLGLAADDCRRATAQREQMSEEHRQAAARSAELQQMQALLEEKLAGQDTEIAAIDDRLREIARQSATLREELAASQMTVRHETSRLQELESERTRLNQQRAGLLSRDTEADSELEHHDRLVRDANREVQQRQESVEACRHREDELAVQLEQQQAELDEIRQELRQRIEQRDALTARRDELQQELQAAEIVKESTSARLTELSSREEACREEFAQREQEQQTAAAAAADMEEQLTALRTERAELQTEFATLEDELSTLRQNRSAAEARQNVLDELERRQQGLGIGVREILHRAATSRFPPWNRIYGTVAELLEVDLEHAALLEVALGSRAQLLVLSEMDSLIEYLRTAPSQISGRVGFLSLRERTPQQDAAAALDDAKPAQPGDPNGQAAKSQTAKTAEAYGPFLPVYGPFPAELVQTTAGSAPRAAAFQSDPTALPDLSAEPGVACRCDRLVRLSHGNPQLAAQLLADTWIVETLDDALRLAAGQGRGCRFVTRQGELLDSDGSLTAGIVRSEAALVSRRSELRRLSQELESLDQRIERKTVRQEALRDLRADCEARLRAAEESAGSQSAEFARTTADRNAAWRRLTRLQQEHELLETELTGQTGRAVRLREELNTLAAEHLEETTALDEHRVHQSELEQLLARTGEQLQQNRQQAEVCRAELTSQSSRLEDYQRSLERLQRDRQERKSQLTEAVRLEATTRDRLRTASLRILNATARVAELSLAVEQYDRDAAGQSLARAEFRRIRGALVSEESALRKERHELDDVQHRTEMQLRELAHQMDSLRERMTEEYQVDLDDVVREGASAFRLYLEEKREQLSRQLQQADRDSSAADAEVSDGEVSGAEDAATDEVSAEEASADDTAAAEGETADSTGDAPSGAESADLPLDPLTDPDSELTFDDVREELEGRVNRLRRKLKMMGSVNTDSLRDLDELETRFVTLSTQLQDLTEARSTLEDIIRRINSESRRLFLETFDAIREHFQELFRRAFGGGNGDIVLEDPDDALECGIDIVARPPGKALKSISLMSGGEKTLTAFALLLAMFRSRPSPFCVLDEVDAALDEANIGRMLALLEEFRRNTQFVVITHRKPTMTIADSLYGVTMEQSGVSRRLSVRFDEIAENGDFAASAGEGDDSDAARAA